MTQSDPLDGADIGDTETVTVTRELWIGDLEADACVGSDRLAESTVIGTETVTNEYGDEYLAVTVESEVTKRLPTRWDSCQEPRTEKEHQQARREKWKRRVGNIAPMLIALGLSGLLAARITNELAGGLVVNGEALPEVGFAHFGVLMLMVLIITVAVQNLPRARTRGQL